MKCDIIVDLQSGDTGKGKVTHSLLKSNNYDLVLRYNGGSNAGHTIYHNGKKLITHQIPAGVLYGIPSLIGLGCVVNLEKLEQEINYLNSEGINTKELIFIDKRCHIVTSEHIKEDNKDSSIGTTKQGIGPTYKSKYGRTGIRLENLINVSNKFTIIDSLSLFDKSSRVLAEGAQGFQLDIDWGDYPYVTSSHCTSGSVCLNGISPKKIDKIYGIAKAYETYVGEKNFGMTHAAHFKIQELGQEYGATTGRPRKVNWINLDQLKMAIKVNGVTNIIINKIDILDQINTYGYILNNEEFLLTDKDQFCNIISNLIEKDVELIFSSTPYDI